MTSGQLASIVRGSTNFLSETHLGGASLDEAGHLRGARPGRFIADLSLLAEIICSQRFGEAHMKHIGRNIKYSNSNDRLYGA